MAVVAVAAAIEERGTDRPGSARETMRTIATGAESLAAPSSLDQGDAGDRAELAAHVAGDSALVGRELAPVARLADRTQRRTRRGVAGPRRAWRPSQRSLLAVLCTEGYDGRYPPCSRLLVRVAEY
jgi:hypothetical protein